MIISPDRNRLSSFYKLNSHRCSGLILNNQWILTTAGCVQDDVAVGFGSNKLETFFVNQRQSIGRVVLQTRKPKNDLERLALVELLQPLTFNETVQPACLADSSFDKWMNENELISTGWGRKTPSVYANLGTNSRSLIKTDFANDIKELYMRPDSSVSAICENKNFICTRSSSTSGWLNEGDIGNPLLWMQADQAIVIGMAVGYEDDYVEGKDMLVQNIKANIFVNLQNQMDFIHEYVRKEEMCIHNPSHTS